MTRELANAIFDLVAEAEMEVWERRMREAEEARAQQEARPDAEDEAEEGE